MQLKSGHENLFHFFISLKEHFEIESRYHGFETLIIIHVLRRFGTRDDTEGLPYGLARHVAIISHDRAWSLHGMRNLAPLFFAFSPAAPRVRAHVIASRLIAPAGRGTAPAVFVG